MSDFQTVFFVHQIKGFSSLLSKKNLKKINLRVRFLPLKIAFFGGFENDNILSFKSYTVTKSGISPQQKLASCRNRMREHFVACMPVYSSHFLIISIAHLLSDEQKNGLKI